MGIPDHLTCLLRNLYEGQEATVRTGHVLGSPVQNSQLEEVLGQMAKGQKYPGLMCPGRKTSPAFGYARRQDLIINIKDVA